MNERKTVKIILKEKRLNRRKSEITLNMTKFSILHEIKEILKKRDLGS
jgi:hypothetical protein